MNRELKFRVWDSSSNKFVRNNQNEIAFDLWDWADLMSNCLIYPTEHYKFQQYTGLTDSKGSPIYEGDIVRDTWKENRPYSYSPDEEYDCSGVFEVVYKDYSFNLERKYSREQTCVDGFYREVIGNIFETPNLLK